MLVRKAVSAIGIANAGVPSTMLRSARNDTLWERVVEKNLHLLMEDECGLKP